MGSDPGLQLRYFLRSCAEYYQYPAGKPYSRILYVCRTCEQCVLHGGQVWGLCVVCIAVLLLLTAIMAVSWLQLVTATTTATSWPSGVGCNKSTPHLVGYYRYSTIDL